MLSLDEVKKLGLPIAGMGQKPDFTISTIADQGADKHIDSVNQIEELVNKQLRLKNYTQNGIGHLTLTYIILPSNWQGVNWKEGKSFKRKEKSFAISLHVPDYDKFCNTTKPEALKILAEQALCGVKKYPPVVKDFDNSKFYSDLEALFKSNGWV